MVILGGWMFFMSEVPLYLVLQISWMLEGEAIANPRTYSPNNSTLFLNSLKNCTWEVEGEGLEVDNGHVGREAQRHLHRCVGGCHLV